MHTCMLLGSPSPAPQCVAYFARSTEHGIPESGQPKAQIDVDRLALPLPVLFHCSRLPGSPGSHSGIPRFRIDASEIAILRSERRNQLNGSQFPSQWVSIRLDPDKCGPKLYGHGSQGGGFGSPETVKLRQSDRI
eukprot:560456-Rhodomonas_salina.1